MIYMGRNIQTEFHSHYATVIGLAAPSPFTINTEDASYHTKCCLIPGNFRHQFLSNSDTLFTFIYLEPTHEYGRKIRTVFNLRHQLTFLESYFPKLLLPLQSLQQKGVIEQEVIEQIIRVFIGESPSLPEMDDRIFNSIQLIHTKLEEKLSLSDIARTVHLSESRFAHLFKEELGVPFRKFVRWKRLKEAGQLILEGHSFTKACLRAGFVDSAHFTKSCQEMFGIAPSKVIKF